jgi:hypothetical protein
MNHAHKSLTHLHLHSIQQREVGLDLESAGVCGMDADRNARSLTDVIERTHVIRMTMSEEDAAGFVLTQGFQNLLGIRTGIDDRHTPRGWAPDQVAVHGPRPEFNTFQP